MLKLYLLAHEVDDNVFMHMGRYANPSPSNGLHDPAAGRAAGIEMKRATALILQ